MWRTVRVKTVGQTDNIQLENRQQRARRCTENRQEETLKLLAPPAEIRLGGVEITQK